jgi:hypothetical protein
MRHADLIKRDAMLDCLRRQSFEYFVHEVNCKNGLVADKTAPDWPASIAAMGMALTVYPIGACRGYMTHAEALDRTLVMMRFLWKAEQGDAVDACGHHGFFYHFLDMETGARAWNCELSSIDTALLMAGVLTAAAYFHADTKEEAEVRSLADSLYKRVDWDWMRNGSSTICHGWRPESGFLPWHWEGYDEALILYVLALGSPTHPIPHACYAAWLATYEWKTVEGVEYLHAGPLFIHQISHAWIDFRGLRDYFMRAHDSDYFQNSCKAAHVQQRYAMRNPGRFDMYGELCWGITASDGPGALNPHPTSSPRVYYDYTARGVPEGPDDGTLAPWAVLASLPFAPEIVLPTIENYMKLQLHVANPYGFKASFNATFTGSRIHPVGWVSPYHFGINEGPSVIMIENFEADSIWRLMRGCPYIVQGLRQAGFRGGWLGEYA